MPTPKETINQLKNIINEHNIYYYVKDNPIISDSEYDELFKKLEKLEKQFPQYITSDSPTQRIGTIPLTEFDTIEHNIPLLSLSNAMNKNDIVDWYDKILKKFPEQNQIETCLRENFRGGFANCAECSQVFLSC